MEETCYSSVPVAHRSSNTHILKVVPKLDERDIAKHPLLVHNQSTRDNLEQVAPNEHQVRASLDR